MMIHIIEGQIIEFLLYILLEKLFVCDFYRYYTLTCVCPIN